MNFFGHAVVASWRLGRPAFALGAMLPDFATMIGARPPKVSHHEVSKGVAFHHETDRVFHAAPTFRELQRAARADLLERGVHRGGALAVAHVGVELLLDQILARQARSRQAYLSALAESADSALGSHIHWTNPEQAARFDELMGALEARGASSDSVGPAGITSRLVRSLASRPRLALHDAAFEKVEAWVHIAAPEVERHTPDLMAEVRLGLGIEAALRPSAVS